MAQELAGAGGHPGAAGCWRVVGGLEAEPDPIAVRADPPRSPDDLLDAGRGPRHDPERFAGRGERVAVEPRPGALPGRRAGVDGRRTSNEVAGAERPPVDPAEPRAEQRRPRPEDGRDVDPARQREVGARPAAGVPARERDRRARRERVRATRQQPPAGLADDATEVRAREADDRRCPHRERRTGDRHLQRRGARVGAGQQVRDREAPRVARAADRHAQVGPVRAAGVLDRREEAGLNDLERHDAAVATGTNRTRSPGRIRAGGSRATSHGRRSVRPISRQPPGVSVG